MFSDEKDLRPVLNSYIVEFDDQRFVEFILKKRSTTIYRFSNTNFLIARRDAIKKLLKECKKAYKMRQKKDFQSTKRDFEVTLTLEYYLLSEMGDVDLPRMVKLLIYSDRETNIDNLLAGLDSEYYIWLLAGKKIKTQEMAYKNFDDTATVLIDCLQQIYNPADERYHRPFEP